MFPSAFYSALRKISALVPGSALVLGLAVPANSFATEVDPHLSFTELGISDSILFPENFTEIPLSIDVPEGTTPSMLTGTLQIPTEFSGGNVELYQNDRLIGTAPIELVKGLSALQLPLAELTVDQGKANFTLRAVLTTIHDQWCFKQPEVRLLDGQIQFSGATPNPSVIADFFPKVLKTLSIYVPESPSEAVQQSALEVATSLSTLYRASGLDIQMESLPQGAAIPPRAAGDFERQIVIVDSAGDSNPNGSTALLNPGQDDVFLQLSGDSETLYDQARLLTNSMMKLAVDEEATATGFVDVPNMFTDVATLQDLGIGMVTSESIAKTTVRLGIDRSRLRAYSKALDMNLIGTYTPLPTQNAGQITFSVGGKILDSFTAGDSGEFDREFTIPGELIDRYTEVVVEFRSTGDVYCGRTQNIGLSIDADSVVNSHHSDVPMLTGFRTLPQGFQPRVDVALSQGDFADLSRAVSMLVGIQSLSSERIRPYLVSWDEALNSERPTVFVDAVGDRLDQVPTYLTQQANTLEIIDGSEQNNANEELTRSLELNSKFIAGVIQAVWDQANNRMVVVASSTQSPDELDNLVSWFDADHDRWGQLSGDLVVKAQNREPVELRSTESSPQNRASSNGYILVALGAISILIIAVIAASVFIRTKRKSD